MEKKTYSTPIRVGIGVAYGRALMVKAGFSGSGIADVVYMGDVVNHAAKLAAKGSASLGTPPLMVSDVFQNNLNEHSKGLLTKDWTNDCYSGDVINLAMEEWYSTNCT